ncbi:CHASE domain-containing protein [bacterium]|nr:MAG: CHASE domain-containing protein [bacterium]
MRDYLTARAQRYTTPQNYLTMAAVISLLVVAAGVVTAYVFSSNLSTQAEIERTNLRTQQSEALTTYIQERAASYEQILLSASGLVKVSGLDNLSAEDWTVMVSSLQMRRLHPELLSMGLVKNSTVTYSEVFDDSKQANVGFNLADEPVRFQTLELARDKAQTTVTPPIILRADANQPADDRPNSLIFFYPLYQSVDTPQTIEERRAMVTGYVYVSVRLQDMMKARQNVLDSIKATYQLKDITTPDIPSLYGYYPDEFQSQVGDTGLVADFAVFNRQWRSEIHLSRPSEQSVLGPLGVFLLGQPPVWALAH